MTNLFFVKEPRQNSWQTKIYDKDKNFLGWWRVETVADSFEAKPRERQERSDFLVGKITESVFVSESGELRNGGNFWTKSENGQTHQVFFN